MSARKLLPVVLVSAVLGGGLAVALVAILHVGATTKTTTVVQQAPLSADRAASDTNGGLTARDIYKRDAPGVVYIKSDIVQQSQSGLPFGFGLPQEQQGTATGSGFVIDKAGHILTNAHVIDGAVKVTVQLQDKRVVEANIVGKDVSTDLAVLKIDPDGLNLRPLQLGSSKNVQVGDPVIAIGNPFGLDRTLTTGVVSALQRRIQAPNGFGIDNVIQTDAAINPGNSGGPLIDAAGRVIGINSQIETGGSGSEGNIGIGFAVPIDTARQILPQLERNGKVQRAFMGVTSLTIDGSLSKLGLPSKTGALVQAVQQGSPAEKAGIKAGDISAQLSDGTPIQLGGDIIVGAAGQPVRTADDLSRIIGAKKPGDSVKIDLIRPGGKHQSVTVKLESRPNAAQQTG